MNTINYIFINPHDIHQQLTDNTTFMNIKAHHRISYKKISGLEIIYWSYNEIAELLLDFDAELQDLFLHINPNYASLLSDIGRFIILYKFGGIYHDLKFISKPKFFRKLDLFQNKYAIVGEQHPKYSHRVRGGNIIAFHPNDVFFYDCS